MARIIALLLVVTVVGAAVWFLSSRNGLQVGTMSAEDRVASLKPKPFKDISSDNENYAAIKYLSREGVLGGDEDGNFNPKEKLTRAEWAVMLVKLAGVTPDQGKYKDCYSDIGKGETEAAICYAKEQGWLKASDTSKNETSGIFVKIVNATGSQVEFFNPNDPISSKAVLTGLSSMMIWDIGEEATGENVFEFAKNKNLIETGVPELTKGEAAELTYRSLATVSLGNETFTPEAENQLERYYAQELVGGGEGIENPFSEFIKGQRDKKYQDLLAQDQASGIETPTFNLLGPLQNFVTGKAGQQPVSTGDVLIYKRTPPNYESQLVSDPMIGVRDSAEMNIFLDKDFRIMTQDRWGQNNPSYIMKMDFHHFYNNGQAVGSILGDLVNFETGVIEQSFQSPRGDFSRLNSLFNTAVNGIESRIGREIAPPAKTEPKTEKSKSDELSPLADDDRPYPRLYFLADESERSKYDKYCPRILFYPDGPPGYSILVCGDLSSEPEDLINLVNQWRTGAIPGPDGRYNTVDGKKFTVTHDVFWACLTEVASLGIGSPDQQDCECRRRLGPQADAWIVTGACDRASETDTGSDSTSAPAKQFDTPGTPWVEPR